jgi:hypothetical protein
MLFLVYRRTTVYFSVLTLPMVAGSVVDPDSDSQYGSESRRAKIPLKNRKVKKLHVLKC